MFLKPKQIGGSRTGGDSEGMIASIKADLVLSTASGQPATSHTHAHRHEPEPDTSSGVREVMRRRYARRTIGRQIRTSIDMKAGHGM